MPMQQPIFSPIGSRGRNSLGIIVNEDIADNRDVAYPFVKWVGGKRSIIDSLIARVPDKFNAYFEPFVGGGALFWNLRRSGKANLSDININLIKTYRSIRDNVEGVISRLEHHKKHHDEKYYAVSRKRLFEATDELEIASLFIYLNKTCYNGLYRVNKSGVFNVPMGRYDAPKIVDKENLRRCAKFLEGVNIVHQGFSQIKPKKGDFVYFDPPYHKTFSGYDGLGFGDKEHKELAAFCRELSQKGVLFMLSNSDTPFIRQLYEGFDIENVEASRFISCKANKRKKINELQIRNYGRWD
jgi:DNA adenine methylase